MDLFSRLQEMAEEQTKVAAPVWEADSFAVSADPEPVEGVKEAKPVDHRINKEASDLVEGLKKIAFAAEDDDLLDADAVEMLRKAIDGQGIS
jgi:hypothetical protein